MTCPTPRPWSWRATTHSRLEQMTNYPGLYDFLGPESRDPVNGLKGKLMCVMLGNERVTVEATEAKSVGYGDDKDDECYTVHFKAPKGEVGKLARALKVTGQDYVSSLEYHEVGQSI